MCSVPLLLLVLSLLLFPLARAPVVLSLSLFAVFGSAFVAPPPSSNVTVSFYASSSCVSAAAPFVGKMCRYLYQQLQVRTNSCIPLNGSFIDYDGPRVTTFAAVAWNTNNTDATNTQITMGVYNTTNCSHPGRIVATCDSGCTTVVVALHRCLESPLRVSLRSSLSLILCACPSVLSSFFFPWRCPLCSLHLLLG